MVDNLVSLDAIRRKAGLPRLAVPDVDPSRKPRPYLRPRQLQSWAAQLPIGNTTVAAHQFLHQLRSLNGAYYPARERLTLLNELRVVLHPLVTALKQSLRQTSLPLDETQRYTAELIQTLLEQMAVGYKLALLELALKDARKLKPNELLLLQESGYLAIVYLSLQLIENYSIYTPSPPRLWHDLNQIYQFAEIHHLHLAAIDEPYPDTPLPVQHNIDFAYKRILLLAMAEPYHLMEYEVEDLYRLIAPTASSCVIEQMSLHIPAGAYAIDLNQDAGPRFISGDTPWQATDGRLLDISAIKSQLELHLQRILRANLQSPILDATTLIERQYRDMLLRLADAWSGSLVRRIQRFSLEGQVQLTVGLNACHHFISGENDFTPAMDELKLLTQRAPSKKSDQHSIFVSAYRDALQRDRKHNTRDYVLNPWWQRNISPIGISLNCQEECRHMPARVGELVAYRFAQKRSTRWRIGVIRWMQMQTAAVTPEQIHVGIMNLATGAVPVGVKGIAGVGAGTDYFRGLFIPRQVALDQSRSLVVPALMYDVNSILAINMKERLFHVRFTHVRLSTRSFTQFDFEIVSTPHSLANYDSF